MNEEQLRNELATVYASKSWRLTKPLRLTMSMVCEFSAFVRNPRPLVGSMLRRAGQYAAIRKHGGNVLRGFPNLHQRVKRVVFAQPAVFNTAPVSRAAFAITASELTAEPFAIICDAVAPAHDTAIPAAGPAPDARLGLAARTVLAELRAARRRFY